jgi:hypothetical protein
MSAVMTNFFPVISINDDTALLIKPVGLSRLDDNKFCNLLF